MPGGCSVSGHCRRARVPMAAAQAFRRAASIEVVLASRARASAKVGEGAVVATAAGRSGNLADATEADRG